MRSQHSASVFKDRTYQVPITIAFDIGGAFNEVLLKKTINVINLASNVVNMLITYTVRGKILEG